MSALLTCGTCDKQYSVNTTSCIHCGEPNPVASKQTEPEKRWYHLKGNVIGLLILFYPAGVYYMWKGDHFPIFIRWLLTLFFVVATLGALAGPESAQAGSKAITDYNDKFSPYCHDKYKTSVPYQQAKQMAEMGDTEIKSEIDTFIDKACSCAVKEIKSSLSQSLTLDEDQVMGRIGKAFLTEDKTILSAAERQVFSKAGSCFL